MKSVILNQDDFICLSNMSDDELEAWFNATDEEQPTYYKDNKGNLYEDFEQCIGE